jgi:hypothetical protein
MTNIYKVAQMFQRKLSLASNGNLENLKSIYQAAKSFALTKDLWMNISKDPYGDSDASIGAAVDNIVALASKAYSQVLSQGMPAAGQFGYAAFLTNIDNAIQNLEQFGAFPSLDHEAASDPTGGKFTNLKKAVSTARASYVPVGIPAQNKQYAEGPREEFGPPEDITGAAYNAPGADPDKLSDVVNNLSGNKKQWGGFFEP